jgi:cysteine desulfurase
MPVYLDCNATTPVEPRVLEEVMRFLAHDFGNAGSRTHSFGTVAKHAVNVAREQVANVVDATSDEVIFTSGATESNNLAILGLAESDAATSRRHIISTQVEHKAVLEPLEYLSSRGFEVELLPVTSGGYVETEQVEKAIRPDTLLVSVMQANNETGVIQPVEEIASLLEGTPVYFHVDAAQGFGKQLPPLKNQRIDLISVSGHKIFAPKGVGALIVRRRGYERIKLQPLMFGGGQERGLRPGTLPVALVAGLGYAAEIAMAEHENRNAKCLRFRKQLLEEFVRINPVFNGDPERAMPHAINLSFPGIDAEALMVALKDDIAISNGSACTSQSYQPSHVLTAMSLPASQIEGSIRISWCHLTEEVDWSSVGRKIDAMRVA